MKRIYGYGVEVRHKNNKKGLYVNDWMPWHKVYRALDIDNAIGNLNRDYNKFPMNPYSHEFRKVALYYPDNEAE